MLTIAPTSGLPCSPCLGVVGLDPCQLHSTSWLLAPCPLGNSQSLLLPDDQGLVARACSDRTNGSDSNLKDGRFRLAVMKLFTVR